WERKGWRALRRSTGANRGCRGGEPTRDSRSPAREANRARRSRRTIRAAASRRFLAVNRNRLLAPAQQRREKQPRGDRGRAAEEKQSDVDAQRAGVWVEAEARSE